MTVEHVEIRAGAYADSVALLQVSRDVAATPGVVAAQVAMATELNLEVLAGMGFTLPPASPNDMVVALRVEDDGVVPAALAAVDAALAAARKGAAGGGDTTLAAPRTTGSALRRAGGGLALVSVPGASALVEAMDALDAGSDVMVFSDNVPVEQELALKRIARDRGLLVMGPDCGTAVVGGVGLGFANTTAPGRVGIVAASGTGCQQVLALLDHAGVGVSAALGVGGRDLSAAIGGISTMTALDRLDADPTIEQVIVVSKPPAAEVAAAVEEYAAGLGTPVRFALLGAGQPDITTQVESLLADLGVAVPEWPTWGSPAQAVGGSALRGLFVGGTLCDEAMLIAAESLGGIRSNIPLSPELALGPDLTAPGHLMIDFGDDGLTRGRAHPMIDPTLRLDQLTKVAQDPDTAVVLLDVVLGHGAQDDPAADLAPAIAAARAVRDVPVVVACVGTSADPQGLQRQAEALAAAGAEVHLSNAAATRRALALVPGGTL
ncbi:FdrA family protein [Nocardioides sp. zg-579]|uniref:FdrA family protein n=1 Tax=Nocardioides marmotae TaxID=2663857 RepID=A0A6I3IXX3_9ACTN|nr:FdrA family protein [Nocardioides marmotae]MCR6029861.1 FdrA family protein [Gordonia jinghuaiqii]MTB93491.1 FdrA family protein [Nocardioides marmotae]QKD99870.1 FdrA family protein [Nocardioides marmotae]